MDAFWRRQTSGLLSSMGISRETTEKVDREHPTPRLVSKASASTSKESPSAIRKPGNQQGNHEVQVAQPSLNEQPGLKDANLPWYMRALQPILDSTKTIYANFCTTLIHTWAPYQVPLPRDTVLVSGMVGLRGSEGSMCFDVTAAYHLLDEEWLVVSLTVRSVHQFSLVG